MKDSVSLKELQSLKNTDLIKTIVKTSIDQIRGKGEQKKKELYNILTIDQKSLLSFWVMYGHTRSGWYQFCLEGITVGGYDHYFSAINEGLIHFKENAMSEIISKAYTLYISNKTFIAKVWKNMENHTHLIEEDQKLLVTLKHQFEEIDRTYFLLLETTIKNIELYIHNHTNVYLEMTNSYK